MGSQQFSPHCLRQQAKSTGEKDDDRVLKKILDLNFQSDSLCDSIYISIRKICDSHLNVKKMRGVAGFKRDPRLIT